MHGFRMDKKENIYHYYEWEYRKRRFFKVHEDGDVSEITDTLNNAEKNAIITRTNIES